MTDIVTNTLKERNWFRSSGMRSKLLLSYFFLIFLTTLFMFLITYQNAVRMAQDRARERIMVLGAVISQQLNREINRYASDVEHYAKTDAPNVFSDSILYTAPARSAAGRTDLARIYLFNRQGNVVYPDVANGEKRRALNALTKEPEYRNAYFKRRTTIFVANDTNEAPGVFYIATPVFGAGGKLSGIAVGEVRFSTSRIAGLTRELPVSISDVRAFLVDADGCILARDSKSEKQCSLFDSGMPLSRMRRVGGNEASMRRLPTEFECNYNSKRYIGASVLVNPSLKWKLVIIQPYETAYAPVRSVSMKILLFAAIALMWGIGFGIYRANRIIQPMGELLSAVEVISRGDYSHRVRLHYRDEIGAFAYAFNKMTSVLEEKIRAHQESQSQLEEAFNQLKNDTLKREETNRELTRKINELTSLSEVTQIITDSLNIDTVLDTIIDTIERIMGFDTCSIKLVDRRTGDLRITVARGLGPEYSAKRSTAVGEGISGLAVKMCRPIVSEDVESDPRIDQSHIIRRLGVKSLISFPLITKKSVMGAMTLYSYERHSFTEDEKRLLSIFANQAAGAIENARLFDSLRDSYLNTIQALSMAIDAKDRYTHGHSKRVSEISVMIGRQIGLSPERLELLKHAGDLHDIGKIGISELIISKESKLTIDEYEIIKTHPLVGEIIIEPVPFLQEARAVIRHHHERWDGFGYPDGLKSDEIPLLSRIILISDAYDAMTSDRPYRKALSHEVAIREIERHSGTQFDPQIVKAFLELFRHATPEDVAKEREKKGVE